MKLILNVICFFVFAFTSLTAFEPLNNIPYEIETKDWSFFNRDQTTLIRQDGELVAVVEGQWSMTKYADQAAYLLKDKNNNCLAQAFSYRKESAPLTLYFHIVTPEKVLGTLEVYYTAYIGNDRRANNATLFSETGAPLLEDDIPLLSTHLSAYIPGTKHQVIDVKSTTILMPDYNKEAQIVDLPYLAETNFTPELFLLYVAIRKDLPNYLHSKTQDVYPIYYE